MGRESSVLPQRVMQRWRMVMKGRASVVLGNHL